MSVLDSDHGQKAGELQEKYGKDPLIGKLTENLLHEISLICEQNHALQVENTRLVEERRKAEARATSLSKLLDAGLVSTGVLGAPTCPRCGSDGGYLGTDGAYFACGKCQDEVYWTADRRKPVDLFDAIRTSPWGRKDRAIEILEARLVSARSNTTRDGAQIVDCAGVEEFDRRVADSILRMFRRGTITVEAIHGR